MKKNSYFKDLCGQRFGSLVVTKKLMTRSSNGSVNWECICDCGKVCVYSERALVHDGVRSCGCYKQQVIGPGLSNYLHRVEGTCVERLLRTKPRSDNKSGHVGVSLKPNGKYQASICLKGKHYYLGTYTRLEDAIAARKRGEQLHIDFLTEFANKNNLKLKDFFDENANEICVLCGKDCPVRKDTPIDDRQYYVEGVGQLCLKCWEDLLKENHSI